LKIKLPFGINLSDNTYIDLAFNIFTPACISSIICRWPDRAPSEENDAGPQNDCGDACSFCGMKMNGKHFLIQSTEFESFESLRHAIAGSNVEIVQLSPHPVRGSLLTASFGNIAFSKGYFSGSIRGSGPLSQTHFCMGLILNRVGDVISFGDDVEPGDIICTPPGEEHYLRFGAAASFASVLITPADLRASFVGESGLDDDAVWANALRFRADARIASEVTRRVLAMSALLKSHGSFLSEAAAEFWRRAMLEAFATTVVHGVPPHRPHIPSPVRLVQEVERYVDIRPDAPVHISEICTAFRVSRRTLHRAFHDAVGIGPIAYLRRKRLCAVHSTLVKADPSRTRVTDIAIEFGFSEMGRFAGQYLSMFGESPSATLRKSTYSIRIQQQE
jgi:AraC family ethanolamine operon transcriptional activator